MSVRSPLGFFHSEASSLSPRSRSDFQWLWTFGTPWPAIRHAQPAMQPAEAQILPPSRVRAIQTSWSQAAGSRSMCASVSTNSWRLGRSDIAVLLCGVERGARFCQGVAPGAGVVLSALSSAEDPERSFADADVVLEQQVGHVLVDARRVAGGVVEQLGRDADLGEQAADHAQWLRLHRTPLDVALLVHVHRVARGEVVAVPSDDLGLALVVVDVVDPVGVGALLAA